MVNTKSTSSSIDSVVTFFSSSLLLLLARCCAVVLFDWNWRFDRRRRKKILTIEPTIMCLGVAWPVADLIGFNLVRAWINRRGWTRERKRPICWRVQLVAQSRSIHTQDSGRVVIHKLRIFDYTNECAWQRTTILSHLSYDKSCSYSCQQRRIYELFEITRGGCINAMIVWNWNNLFRSSFNLSIIANFTLSREFWAIKNL